MSVDERKQTLIQRKAEPSKPTSILIYEKCRANPGATVDSLSLRDAAHPTSERELGSLDPEYHRLKRRNL